jgi:hypothetical protein
VKDRGGEVERDRIEAERKANKKVPKIWNDEKEEERIGGDTN